MLEPLPETAEALAEYLSLADPDLDETFVAMGETAHEIVPELVGMSLTLVREGVTFTLAAPNVAVASLDAMQYLEDGPCERALEEAGPVLTETESLLDEQLWLTYAGTAAAAGVASSLSMPILDGEEVSGGLNFYAGTAEAFEGRHEALAAALGASAKRAVTNADLSFSTRLQAVEAPRVLRDALAIDTATGLVAARSGESVEQARARLEGAAVRADVPLPVIARVVISVHNGELGHGDGA
jgi:GAF domain-containing protein